MSAYNERAMFVACHVCHSHAGQPCTGIEPSGSYFGQELPYCHNERFARAERMLAGGVEKAMNATA